MPKKNQTVSKKLQNILNELAEMKAELLPDAQNPDELNALANLDSFGRLQHELNAKLNRIRHEVDRLNELRKVKANKNNTDGRDATTIKIQSENNRNLRTCTELFNQLKQTLIKDEQTVKLKKKSKLTEKDLIDRRQQLVLIADNIKLLTEQNSRVKSLTTDGETAAMEQRVEEHRNKQRDDREARREKRRKAKQGKDGVISNADAFNANELKYDAAPQSEQEQAFEQRVAENNADQNLILQEIAAGLEELQMLATEANKHLVVQAAMLEQVDEKIDKNIRVFKTANARLQDILEQSGGLSRWCPIIICIVILIAVLGYIFHVV